jgi:hypothetical protein
MGGLGMSKGMGEVAPPGPTMRKKKRKREWTDEEKEQPYL